MWGHGWHGMMGYGGGWGGMMLFGGLFWLVLLALVAAGVAWLVGAARRRGAGMPFADPGYPELAILEQRYASSEITPDEYLEKKEDMLGHGRSVPAP